MFDWTTEGSSYDDNDGVPNEHLHEPYLEFNLNYWPEESNAENFLSTAATAAIRRR